MAKTDASLLVLDTSLLIDYLRGSSLAGEFLDFHRAFSKLVCSHVSAAELIVGARSRSELREIGQLLDRLQLEPITAMDSARALKWLRKYYPAVSIGYLDCLIGATTTRLNGTLVTLNDKHFAHLPGLNILRPY